MEASNGPNKSRVVVEHLPWAKDSYGTWRMHREEKLHPSPMNILSKSFAKHITPENTKASLSHFQSFPKDFHLKILSTNLLNSSN